MGRRALTFSDRADMGVSDERCHWLSFFLVGSARVKRPSKVMANAFRAGFHLVIHRARPLPVGSSDLVTRYRHLRAAWSLGKWPRARTARR